MSPAAQHSPEDRLNEIVCSGALWAALSMPDRVQLRPRCMVDPRTVLSLFDEIDRLRAELAGPANGSRARKVIPMATDDELIEMIGWVDVNGDEHRYDGLSRFYALPHNYLAWFGGVQYDLHDDGWLRPMAGGRGKGDR